MKFKVTEIKEFSESISLDSLKEKFLSEGWLEENGTFTKDGKTITPISESKGKYLDELEDDESLSDKARKDFSDLSKWVYDQKWSDGSEKLSKELEKRAKDLEKKHKVKIRLDGITNESFNKSEFDKVVDTAVTSLYKGLNDIELIFGYLKSNGQGGLIGAYKKKIKYDKIKKLIEEIEKSVDESLSENFDENQTEVNKHVKVRFNGRVSVYFSDGSEVYTSPKDGSFEYGGVRFLANYNKGLLGLHDVMKDMNNAFENITFELVQDLKSNSIFEAVEKADIEKVKNGSKLQLASNIQFLVKGKSKYGFTGDLIGKSGKVISVSAEVPFSNFSNPHYNKNISIVENFSHKLVNENVSMELSRFFWDILTGFRPYNLIWEENGKYCFGKKDNKGNLETYVAKGAVVIKFAQSIFKLAKKGSKINFTHVEVNNGNITELMVSNKNKGKKYSNEKLDDYGNREGIEDVSVGNTPYTYTLLKEKPVEESFDDVFEKKGDLVKDNPNAGKLLANWIGLSKLEELNTFTNYHKLLPQIEQCLVDIKKGKEKSHKCIYKIISDNILKTELFDDDKKSLDRSINAYKKYGFVLL